jgi:hypothetical protein
MKKQWFDVDKDGLGKQAEELGKGRLIGELVQNALDEAGVTRIDIRLELVPGRPVADLTVEDDGPEGFRDLADAYTLIHCKMAVRKINAERERFRRWEKEIDLENEHLETVRDFRDAAENLTWTQALALIGPQTDLVDGRGKPRSRRHAKVLAFIKKAFQRARRWHQRYAAKRRSEERLARVLQEYDSQLAAEQSVGQP